MANHSFFHLDELVYVVLLNKYGTENLCSLCGSQRKEIQGIRSLLKREETAETSEVFNCNG